MREKEDKTLTEVGQIYSPFTRPPSSSSEGSRESQKSFASPRFFFDKHRFTYTFLFDGEVASVHFDANRAEIFFKGHNIRNMKLSESQIHLLKQTVLQVAESGQSSLAEHYRACLLKVLNS